MGNTVNIIDVLVNNVEGNNDIHIKEIKKLELELLQNILLFKIEETETHRKNSVKISITFITIYRLPFAKIEA